jgi:hypothetical protein
MSIDRSAERLLQWYPPSWRKRYGEELAGLLVEMSDGGRLSWRLRADVVAAGARERFRGPRIGDSRGGGRMVLWAWATFVLAGMIVAKTSEQWRLALPKGGHPVASIAFVVLSGLAAATAVLVLAGIALTVPTLMAFLRSGGWPRIRRWFLVGTALAVLLVAATAGLAAWAHGLTPRARNGHDALYGAAFLTWGALAAATLLAWTKAATSTVDQLPLSARTLQLHARLTTVIAATMTTMTVATMTWWTAVAIVSPGALTGPPASPHASPVVPALTVAVAFMAFATALATVGARRANTA